MGDPAVRSTGGYVDPSGAERDASAKASAATKGVEDAATTVKITKPLTADTITKPLARPRRQRKDEDTMTYMKGYLNDWRARGSPDEWDGDAVQDGRKDAIKAKLAEVRTAGSK